MWGVDVSVLCRDMGGQCNLKFYTREKCEGVILDSNCSKVWGGMAALCEYGWEVQFEVLYQGEVRRWYFGFKLQYNVGCGCVSFVWIWLESAIGNFTAGISAEARF